MSAGAAFPGLVQFYVTDGSTEGIVVGWDDGYLVVMTDTDEGRRLQKVDPWKARVVGHAQITATGDDAEEAEIIDESAKGVACA